jgi:hypothetical protein
LALNRGAHPSVFDFNARVLGVADGSQSKGTTGQEARANIYEVIGVESVHDLEFKEG